MAELNRLPQFARKLLASCPTAGNGVHNWLFRAARVLHRYYPNKRELALLLEAASANCGREVPEREIIDAITNSESCAWNPGQKSSTTASAKAFSWPRYNRDLAENIVEEISLQEHPRSCELFDQVSLGVRSPVCWPDVACAATVLRLLYPDCDPLICAGWNDSNRIATGPLSEWDQGVPMRRPRGFGNKPMFLDDMQFVVPNAMVAEDGISMRGRESVSCGDEFMQPALHWHLRELAPLALCVHSGRRSIHGWYYVEPQSDEWQMRFFRYAVALGADHQIWWPEQLVRMPNGQRRDEDGKVVAKQKVIYFDPHCIDNQRELPERFGFYDPAWLKEADQSEGASHGEVR